jgi:glycosyltransferase involved in cell wall biosynthesis
VKRIDLVEVGGKGGVYQHTVEVARLLMGSSKVVLHTSTDAEILSDDVEICACFDWHRHRRHLRGVYITFGFLLSTVPHLVRQRSKLTWVQGGFKLPLTAVLVAVLHLAGRPTLFSPHNLFSRSGNRLDEACLNVATRCANGVVVYNDADKATLSERGRGNVIQLPLVQWAPEPSASVFHSWRAAIPSNERCVAFVGQVREDKGLPLLIEAAAAVNVRVVVFGPDAGDLDASKRLATSLGAKVSWFINYHPLVDLVALMVVVDCVACPYSRVSQSGVESLAERFGVRVLPPRMDWRDLPHRIRVARWAQAIDAAARKPKEDARLRPANYSLTLRRQYLDAAGIESPKAG